MAQPFSISLTLAQVQELEQVRDHHSLAYVRVKAAGILKVRQGQSLRHVAKNGLLKPVRRETVKAWIVRYQHDGVVSKRGRASVHSPDLAYDEKLAVIAQARQRSQADPERFPFLLTIDFSSVRQISCICTQLNRASCSATSFTLLLSVFVESRFNCNSTSRRVCQWRFAV